MLRSYLVLFAFLAVPLSVLGENWPGFRGPTGQGISSEKGLPTKWSATEGVIWNTPIPGEGWSSPIVWGDRVFLTAATDGGEGCRVLALSRTDGKVLWNEEVFRQKKMRKEGKNSYATPTPVTDGEHVYAVFNDGSIAALTVEGKVVWTYREVKYYSQHGLGNSPVLYQDLLIMPFDGSSEGPDKLVGWQKPWDQSFILALDKKTGKEKWRGKRGQSRIAHTTPILIKVGDRDELISTAGDVIQGFDPQTGERRWSVKAEGEGVSPSPVYGDGLVFASSGFGNATLRAVNVNPSDEPSTRKVTWELKKNVPMIPSMVYAKPHLFTVSEKGFATCLEASSGKVLWTERLPGAYSASPVCADGLIYFLSEEGESTIIKASDTFEVVARNTIKEPFQASMAISNGQLFLRSKQHLFCIGKP